MSKSVAVVGAAGYVGRELLRQLEAVGVPATAVVRGPRALAVDGDFHEVLTGSEAGSPRFDVVINLAYPTSGMPYEYPDQNAAIVDSVAQLVKNGGTLIHASTLAVFGMALDRPIVADSVSRVRDHAYVEAKVEAELLFRRLCKARGLSLEIVRFGNIWGAGSGAWAVPLVHRLVTGRPVGVVGAPGYSNATDVANAAAYLSFLLQSEPSDEIRYHHVAELSHVRWSELLRPLAAMIGVDPVYAEPSVLDVPSSGLGEVSASLAAAHPRTVFKRLGDERVLGSWTRTVKRRFPARMRRRLQGVRVVHAQAEDVARLEQTILGILSGAHRFDPVVEPEWTPPITQDASVSAVMEWLDWNSRP